MQLNERRQEMNNKSIFMLMTNKILKYARHLHNEASTESGRFILLRRFYASSSFSHLVSVWKESVQCCSTLYTQVSHFPVPRHLTSLVHAL